MKKTSQCTLVFHCKGVVGRLLVQLYVPPPPPEGYLPPHCELKLVMTTEAQPTSRSHLLHPPDLERGASAPHIPNPAGQARSSLPFTILPVDLGRGTIIVSVSVVGASCFLVCPVHISMLPPSCAIHSQRLGFSTQYLAKPTRGVASSMNTLSREALAPMVGEATLMMRHPCPA